MTEPGTPLDIGIGVVVPHDMALDRELWRWAPQDVSLYFTRTPDVDLPVTVELAAHIGDVAVVRRAAADFRAVGPAVVAYACTAGSFVRGAAGERALVEAMEEASAPVAVTTSGALVEALRHVGAGSVAIATPYDEVMTELLADFLGAAGIHVVRQAYLGVRSGIWRVPYERTWDLVIEADTPSADAVVVSCTNLRTYDVIAALEDHLGKPVVTANQATMWAALRAIDHVPALPGQRLFTVAGARR